MAYDGIISNTIVTELNNCLINGKINKIYQPTKNEIILSIYANGNNYALNANISSNCYRFNLTTTSKPNPQSAPNFCMVLRKHLIGSKINKIYMNGLERIIFIELQCYNELNDLINKKLVIELMGKHSNIILLNENNIIIDSIRHLDQDNRSYRDVLPAHPYIFPDSKKSEFFNLSKEAFYDKIINSDKDTHTETDNIKFNLINCLTNSFTGFSKVFITNTLSNLEINNIESLNDYTPEISNKIYNYIKEIITNPLDNSIGCISLEKDYTISKKSNIRESSEVSNLQTNFFLDDYYSNKEENELLTSYRNNLLRLILNILKKVNKKLINIDNKIKECNNMDTYRLYGELITSNLYQISNENVESITVDNYYENNNKITIPLDITTTPANNAKKYFKKYNKLKTALEIVTKQKLETINEIQYLESIVYELEAATTVSEIDSIYSEISENILFKNEESNKRTNSKNKKNNKVKTKLLKQRTSSNEEPIFYKIDKYTLVVGKNNKQNDYLSTKLIKNHDIWFHTKDIHGSHAILITNGEQINDDIIVKCAEIAAYHSKAKLSSNVPVDYTFGKYLRKPNGAKPGMVIFTNNNTINVTPRSQENATR